MMTIKRRISSTDGNNNGGAENAGHENAGHEIAGHAIARHDKCLFIVVSTNPSNFSSIVEYLM